MHARFKIKAALYRIESIIVYRLKPNKLKTIFQTDQWNSFIGNVKHFPNNIHDFLLFFQKSFIY